MKLVISLATRGRPKQLVETINRSVVNLACDNTDFIVQTDDDDPASAEAVRAGVTDPRVRVNSAPREDTIAAKWNRALSVEADVYSVAADDDPYITPGYDAKILEAASRFPDGIGMVYGHMANASFTCSLSMTRRLAEKLGYIQPELFPYWFVDHWTDDLARIMGRISVADIRTDQSKAGKTQEMREPGWWATFFDAAYLMRRQIARDIVSGQDFQSPQWLKETCLSQAPLIEYRSKWINSSVRAQSKQYEQWSGLHNRDERYQRIRAKAVEMIPHLLNDYGMPTDEQKMYQDYLLPPSSVISLGRAYA